MYLEVYPDILFILNFFLDFILLFLMKKVNRRESKFARRGLAAILGAFVAAIVGIFPWMNIIIRFLLMNVTASALMLLIAFGRMKKMELLKQIITFYLITYFVGGLMNSVYYHTNMRRYLITNLNHLAFSNISYTFVITVILVVIPITILLLWLFRWYQSDIRETLEIELFFADRSIRTKGLMDTGNCLYDPIFRKPVIIVEEELLQDLLSLELHNEFDTAKRFMEGEKTDTEQLEDGKGQLLPIRIIPYQSIGKVQGMMLGLVLDKVLVHNGKETRCNEKVTAAICENQLSPKNEYHAILHKELI